jgi:glycosyltransferase involved in cell wall biosynthesis
MNRRIIFYTSTRITKVKETDTAETHFATWPFSLGAIRYNLEKLGWTTRYVTLTTAKSLLRTTRLIDSFKPDIIYTYGSTVALNPLICRPFCRHKAFQVIHGWDDVYGEVYAEVFGKIPGLFMDWMERRIIQNSDGVVTLSHYNLARGREWGVESHYIPNGADVPVIDPAQRTINLAGRFNLVYTGSTARWKRTDEICEAMRHLPMDIKLYITGDIHPYLEPYLSENCIYLGYVPKQVQLNVMAQADAFVVTADQDCNAKLQEYLRFKKPILGYDGRLNRFFTNGRNALLTRDYAASIRRLVDDPELRQSLADNAAKDIPVYTWLEIAQQFDAYLSSTAQMIQTGNTSHEPFRESQ